ncbi:hypothetical protein [Caballeronia temeraria]|uniref:hypothetical protein n=1 Tax=Caballeronia temeraria TaxID=1777137 RepID=UPI0012FE4772|nr:hypothetical protein [Caballeronia temeraria]
MMKKNNTKRIDHAEGPRATLRVLHADIDLLHERRLLLIEVRDVRCSKLLICI